ncbi:MAG: DUF4169 family protein [Pseudomonadota bacterium]|nr:DUF4169 family protein [Pseudomonadota bacterium]
MNEDDDRRGRAREISAADMGDVLNLRTARKRAARQRQDSKAAANRLAHGRPKAKRTFDAALDGKARHDLDQHRIGGGESNEIARHKTLDSHRRPQDKRQS